jgi:type IV secretion system protein VirD4
MDWWKTERQKWAESKAASHLRPQLGLTALDPASRELFEKALPRDVQSPRLEADRRRINSWMSPHELAGHTFVPGQIIIGKFAGRLLGHLDDRPQVTVAASRSGKTSTVLEPNLYCYPGSMLVMDPKRELIHTAAFRRAMGHNVHILDPFGDGASSNFNPLAELKTQSRTIIDDVRALADALIVDDGDARSRHWNDGAKTLLVGIILLTLMEPADERNLVTVRQILTLTYPPLAKAITFVIKDAQAKTDEKFYDENRIGVESLLKVMSRKGDAFGGILAAIGNRFLGTPHPERGSIFSTASTQTDFLDSLPLRDISRISDFRLSDLRSDRPTTIYLCLPVGRMESHYRWLRLVIQMACTVLEQMGTYPRDRPPILFMMEEFAALGHFKLMEKAAAYFPGFGIKLWVVLQTIGQLKSDYRQNWEAFMGNAGLVQLFANGDQSTLDYIAQRVDKLIAPFELRTAFSRQRFSQLLLMEGLPPAAALRLGHDDVAAIRAQMIRRAPTRTASSVASINLPGVLMSYRR